MSALHSCKAKKQQSFCPGSVPTYGKSTFEVLEMTRQTSFDKKISIFIFIFVNFQATDVQQQIGPQKQIPVISDIERIKKIVEILEFVGEKVGDLLQALPPPKALISPGGANRATDEKRIIRNDSNVAAEAVTETILDTASFD